MSPLLALAAAFPKLTHLGLMLAQANDELNPQPLPPAPNPLVGIVGLLIAVIAIVSLWKVFTKAGQPGWASIIPIYNAYILLKIAGKPGWWLLLLFIPLVNFVMLIVIFIALAQSFGKGAGFGLGLAFLGFIFLPILAFGDARYQGATAVPPALV